MDVSGSMRATDVSPSRLDAAKASALSFIDQLPESRIGYTEERQEVTFALVGAGLLLVVLGAGLSAVWFGRLP